MCTLGAQRAFILWIMCNWNKWSPTNCHLLKRDKHFIVTLCITKQPMRLIKWKSNVNQKWNQLKPQALTFCHCQLIRECLWKEPSCSCSARMYNSKNMFLTYWEMQVAESGFVMFKEMVKAIASWDHFETLWQLVGDIVFHTLSHKLRKCCPTSTIGVLYIYFFNGRNVEKFRKKNQIWFDMYCWIFGWLEMWSSRNRMCSWLDDRCRSRLIV